MELSSFEEVMNKVQTLDDRRMTPQKIQAKSRGLKEDPGYSCSHMSTWRWMKNGTVYVPGFGTLMPTKHATMQIGGKLGIKVPKFLGPIMHDPELIQQTLTPHLHARRKDDSLIVKAVARAPGEKEEKLGVNGILRGVVGPNYAEIRDVHVLETLQKVAGIDMDHLRVSLSQWSDAATYISFVDEEKRKLGILKDIGDEIHAGFKLWNSEVGARSLGASTFVHRLVCTNGMVADVEGDRLLHRRHTPITPEDLEELFRNMWEKVPERADRIVAKSEELHGIEIDDPEAEIVRFLRTRNQPGYIREAAVKAFQMEPINTAYGILQAITRTGVALRSDPERQLEFEELGGDYMTTTLKKAA